MHSRGKRQCRDCAGDRPFIGRGRRKYSRPVERPRDIRSGEPDYFSNFPGRERAALFFVGACIPSSLPRRDASPTELPRYLACIFSVALARRVALRWAPPGPLPDDLARLSLSALIDYPCFVEENELHSLLLHGFSLLGGDLKRSECFFLEEEMPILPRFYFYG